MVRPKTNTNMAITVCCGFFILRKWECFGVHRIHGFVPTQASLRYSPNSCHPHQTWIKQGPNLTLSHKKATPVAKYLVLRMLFTRWDSRPAGFWWGVCVLEVARHFFQRSAFSLVETRALISDDTHVPVCLGLGVVCLRQGTKHTSDVDNATHENTTLLGKTARPKISQNHSPLLFVGVNGEMELGQSIHSSQKTRHNGQRPWDMYQINSEDIEIIWFEDGRVLGTQWKHEASSNQIMSIVRGVYCT